MLPKPNRLQKRKDIKKILEKGRGIKKDFLALKVLANNSDKNHFLFIVSQKVSKKASQRNKIKRRLRELVSLRKNKIKKGQDVAIIALSGLETKNFKETGEIMNKLFQKAKIFKE